MAISRYDVCSCTVDRWMVPGDSHVDSSSLLGMTNLGDSHNPVGHGILDVPPGQCNVGRFIASPGGKLSPKVTEEECGQQSGIFASADTSSRNKNFAVPLPTSLRSATFPPGEGIVIP